MNKSAIIIIMLIFIPSQKVIGQSFGFGCLGLVGGYAGYSFQIYEPSGLNNFTLDYNKRFADSIGGTFGEFGKSTGYRLGINFFRANIQGFILTVKGNYQSLLEKQSKNYITRTNSNVTLEFKHKSWGLGLDLGTSITKFLSWKVLDAGLTYNHLQFTVTEQLPGHTAIEKYTNDWDVGYFVGTGFIFELIDDYVSLEGTAGYSVLSIDKVNDEQGNVMKINGEDVKEFYKQGGFNAIIQLNFGLPL